ncbi:MAG: MacB family efflux pump subunit [Methylovulum sp.]|nr:MacB family efflux pump subunit [Methylovulum sp.]
MNAMPLLELVDIQRHYPNGETLVKALDGISLKVWPGEFVAIIGQSGSGKSTLMNLIGCLDKASQGRYHIRGQDVAGLDSDQLAALRRGTFGFVLQRYNLLNTATAAENVEIPALYEGLAKAERQDRALALLERLGLADRGGHKPMQLSGGQQQRVAIARALMNDPPVILADEPTGALDSQSGKEVMVLLSDLHREGRTILLITHDEKVAAHAGRIINLCDGKVVSDTGENRAGNYLPPTRQRGIGAAGILAELVEAAKMALRSLHANVFRTALTLLGIVIGVAAVVTMLAIGQGSQEKVLEQMRAMGTDILSIRPGAPGLRGSSDVATLTPADAEAIAELDNVEWASPERNARMTVRYGNIDYATSIQGVAPSMTEVREWAVAEGDFFDDRDMRRYAPVLVLGETVKQILFPDGSDPVGRYVMVGSIPFEVIGVMTAKGADAMGTDRDDSVFVPLSTGLIRLFGQAYLGGITVKVHEVAQIDGTQEAITEVLLDRHQTEDFRIRNMASIIASAAETQKTFTLMLGIVAAISLLVGGIGVMNIMLVSVTERTREIGIRMATGARRRDILLQFNTEAAVVCTLGGFMGVILGFAAGILLRYFDMAVVFSPLPAVMAFSCAFATGLLFGYLPARKAASLDPVVALAAE